MAQKRAMKGKTADARQDDPILTDIDIDSDIEEHQVRLPHGLSLDVDPPRLEAATEHEVEQECQRQPRDKYIAMSIFQNLSMDVPTAGLCIPQSISPYQTRTPH